MQRSGNMLPITKKKVASDRNRHRASRNVGINR